MKPEETGRKIWQIFDGEWEIFSYASWYDEQKCREFERTKIPASDRLANGRQFKDTSWKPEIL